jgi:GNAT superfamily N-acetyltransferase
MLAQLTIRNADASDIPLILALIKELAEIEKFPFEITVTAEDLKRRLFQDKPAAEAIIFLVDNDPAGFAVYYHTFAKTTGKRGLHLDDIYVRPQYQGSGVGKKVLGHLATLAKERGCGRFEWWALEWNEKAVGFYESIGARNMQELRIFRLRPDLSLVYISFKRLTPLYIPSDSLTYSIFSVQIDYIFTPIIFSRLSLLEACACWNWSTKLCPFFKSAWSDRCWSSQTFPACTSAGARDRSSTGVATCLKNMTSQSLESELFPFSGRLDEDWSVEAVVRPVVVVLAFLVGVFGACKARNDKRPAVAHTILSVRGVGVGLGLLLRFFRIETGSLRFFRIEIGRCITLFLDGGLAMPFLEWRSSLSLLVLGIACMEVQRGNLMMLLVAEERAVAI